MQPENINRLRRPPELEFVWSRGTWVFGGGDHQSQKVKDKLKGEMTKEELLNKLQEIQKENVNQQLWN